MPGTTGVAATAPGAGPVLDRGPAPSVSPPPSSRPGTAVASADPGRVAPGAGGAGPTPADGGGVRPVPFPTTGAGGRRRAARRREDPRPAGSDASAGGPGNAVGPAGADPAAPEGSPAGPASSTPPPGGPPGPATGGHGHPGAGSPAAPGPLDAAPLGVTPVTGGAGDHRLPPRRVEYLVDPDPAGWGADATRRVAPPVLGEDDDHDARDGRGGERGAPS